MKHDSKKAAIIGAVMSYLEEEAAFHAQLQEAKGETATFARPSQANLWGLNGRQTQMQIRLLMGMRTFNRA